MDREQYEAFVDALLAADKTEFREFEGTPYFDGCLPIEVMAARGRETLRHGPMKPVGLTNAHEPTVKPYAVVQLRQDNALGTLFNMVGFQTKLKYGEQARVFRRIPGLQRAEFARLGGLHRNTYLNSPRPARPSVCASRSSRGCASPARSPAAKAMSRAPRSASSPGASPPPSGSARRCAPAADHRDRRVSSINITGGHIEFIDAGPRSFQPMNVNFGLFPPIVEPRVDEEGKRLRGPERGVARKRALSARAEADLAGWMASVGGAEASLRPQGRVA